MRRLVALIRGINVGCANRVAMADLRAVVSDLGYTDVRTLLNSGNVVFGMPTAAQGDAATRIQEGIGVRLGVSARVIVITANKLADIIADNSLRGVATNPARFLVSFFSGTAVRGET